jgi:hypothetical protein
LFVLMFTLGGSGLYVGFHSMVHEWICLSGNVV